MTNAHSTTWIALTSRAGITYSGAVLGNLALLSVLRLRMRLLILAVFPGTLFHELSHLAAAALLHGQPTGFHLLPRRTDRTFILGSVVCANVRWYNGLFIGLAPLLLLPLAFGLMLWRLSLAPVLHAREVPWIYLIACLAYAAVPSWQDLQVAAKSRWMLIGVGAVAWVVRVWWL